MKTKQYNVIIEKLYDDIALDFIKDNISMLVDCESIDTVYKQKRTPQFKGLKMERYWERALKICEELYNLDEEQIADINLDKIPTILEKKYIGKIWGQTLLHLYRKKVY